MKIEQDPYEVLGVTRSATDEDVEEAFKRLARRKQPDPRPRDSKVVLAFAAVALLCAVSYLVYLLLR
jgi:curved DNA-binding protein CbpA